MSTPPNIYKITCFEESGGTFNVNAVDETEARTKAEALLNDKGFDSSLPAFNIKHGDREVQSVEYVGQQIELELPSAEEIEEQRIDQLINEEGFIMPDDGLMGDNARHPVDEPTRPHVERLMSITDRLRRVRDTFGKRDSPEAFVAREQDVYNEIDLIIDKLDEAMLTPRAESVADFCEAVYELAFGHDAHLRGHSPHEVLKTLRQFSDDALKVESGEYIPKPDHCLADKLVKITIENANMRDRLHELGELEAMKEDGSIDPVLMPSRNTVHDFVEDKDNG